MATETPPSSEPSSSTAPQPALTSKPSVPGPNFRLVQCMEPEQAGGASQLKFSPNGLWLATSFASGTIKIINALTGDVHYTLSGGHKKGVNTIAWSPNCTHLATGSDDGTVCIWNWSKTAVVFTLRGHSSYVFCIAYNSTGTLLASGSFDETVRLWDTTNGRPIRTLVAHSEPVTSLCFSGDGTLLATGSFDGLVRMWDTTSGNCLLTLSRTVRKGDQKQDLHYGVPVTNIIFSPNSKYILVSTIDHKLKLWNYNSGKCLKTYSGHTNKTYCMTADFLLYSAHTQYIVNGSEDGRVFCWDLQTKNVELDYVAHSKPVLAVSTNPRLHVLATCGMDGSVKIWYDHSVNKESAVYQEIELEQRNHLNQTSDHASVPTTATPQYYPFATSPKTASNTTTTTPTPGRISPSTTNPTAEGTAAASSSVPAETPSAPKQEEGAKIKTEEQNAAIQEAPKTSEPKDKEKESDMQVDKEEKGAPKAKATTEDEATPKGQKDQKEKEDSPADPTSPVSPLSPPTVTPSATKQGGDGNAQVEPTSAQSAKKPDDGDDSSSDSSDGGFPGIQPTLQPTLRTTKPQPAPQPQHHQMAQLYQQHTQAMYGAAPGFGLQQGQLTPQQQQQLYQFQLQQAQQAQQAQLQQHQTHNWPGT